MSFQKKPLKELVQPAEPQRQFRPAAGAVSSHELLEEIRKLEVLLHDYEQHKREVARHARENRRMLYMILVTNLAIFAFIIGAMIRFFIK